MNARNKAVRRGVVSTLTVALCLGGFVYACVESKITTNQPSISSTAESSNSSQSSNSSAGASRGFDRNALLASLAENVIVPTYAELVTATAALETAAAAYATSLSPSDLAAARVAWRAAMHVWQRAELTQLGPAGISGAVPGGQDLRDEIYSWPLVNRCRTDTIVVSGDYAHTETFANELVNVRGLDALEYLLFNESTANACAPQTPINAEGSWDALTDVAQRRADFAHSLSLILHEHAQVLHAAWDPQAGNFTAELAGAGQSATTYDSAQAALNAVSDAMFYIEGVTKDVKLAVPTGLSPDCSSDTCPNDLELAFSHDSKEAIRQNIIGFAHLLSGGTADDALGFYDWLRHVGAGDLADTMQAKIDDAEAAVDAIEEDDLAVALANDPASVEALYFALKSATDLLKSDFITVLDLELPQDVQGDND